MSKLAPTDRARVMLTNPRQLPHSSNGRAVSMSKASTGSSRTVRHRASLYLPIANGVRSRLPRPRIPQTRCAIELAPIKYSSTASSCISESTWVSRLSCLFEADSSRKRSHIVLLVLPACRACWTWRRTGQIAMMESGWRGSLSPVHRREIKHGGG